MKKKGKWKYIKEYQNKKKGMSKQKDEEMILKRKRWKFDIIKHSQNIILIELTPSKIEDVPK